MQPTQPPAGVDALIPDTTIQALTPESAAQIPADLGYIALLFALFVLPKALQRYRIPGAVTSLMLGVVASALGWFHGSDVVQLLSTFGIVSLFLFAGLEIDGQELRDDAKILIQHGAIWSTLLVATAMVCSWLFSVSGRTATLLALALVTPSTGFILSSLGSFGLRKDERRSVKAKAIAAELLALLGLFVVLQSTSIERLAIATAAMIGIVLFIPLAFRFFAKVVAPYAPRSEFAFLLMVAVICAYATRRLGVYYLVGAFVVGVAAQRFRTRLPAMSSEKMVEALEAFGSVFIPFYFFAAGTHIDLRQLDTAALLTGLAFLVVMVPLRVALTIAHRKRTLGELRDTAQRVGVAMVPTLVFTLVLSEILRDRFAAPTFLVGGLVIYTVVNTMLPAYALRGTPPDFEHPEASDVTVLPEPGSTPAPAPSPG